mmetsp:Transcript_117643/g.340089  ORF Transcript_117643/g.340089 Transcript_117643/m.340089 type:complete len:289 (-) Transcript_117643:223-1089(-)
MGNKPARVPSSPSGSSAGAPGSARVAMAPRPRGETPQRPQTPQRWAWTASPPSSARSRSSAYVVQGGQSTPLDRSLPRRAPTPSTITPGSGSRRTSVSNSPADTFSEASSSSAFTGGGAEDPAPERRLTEARQRAAESLEALQLELKGFGGAVAVRYASWPTGTMLEVMPPMGSASRTGPLQARLVRYDAASNSFEVELKDGSTRMVPAKLVRRAPGGGARRPATSHSLGGRSGSATVPAGHGSRDLAPPPRIASGTGPFVGYDPEAPPPFRPLTAPGSGREAPEMLA